MTKKFPTTGLSVCVLLTDAFGGFGGISKFNKDLLRALDHAAHVASVIALPRSIVAPIVEEIPEGVIFDRRSARGKIAFIRRWLWTLFSRSRLQLVICGHIHLLPLAWILARLRRSRLALIIHGLDAWQKTSHLLVNILAKRVDNVISVSAVSAERFRSWSGISADKCFILPNCVDLETFAPAPPDEHLIERHGLKGRLTLMTVGRLASKERCKGFDEVLTVLPALCRSYPNLTYLIVGDGEDRPRLEERALSLGVSDNVIFTGKILEEEKAAYYNIADLYVMPSSGEGFGIVYLEAAACGVPIIGSSVDGSREALLNGDLGTLVDPTDLDELKAVILNKLANLRREQKPGIANFTVERFEERFASWVGSIS